MDDEFSRETEPGGALDPPRKNPPTAVATATPGPAPERRSSHARDRGAGTVATAASVVLPFLSRALDVVDVVADALAEALNLRPEKT